jgi:glycerol-3-phosphate dehydrogenase
LSPAAPHIAAEVVHAARSEGVATLDDVLSRRTRLSLRARDAALPSAPLAASLLARELGHDEAWAKGQVEAYAAAVRAERGVLGLQVEASAG